VLDVLEQGGEGETTEEKNTGGVLGGHEVAKKKTSRYRGAPKRPAPLFNDGGTKERRQKWRARGEGENCGVEQLKSKRSEEEG